MNKLLEVFIIFNIALVLIYTFAHFVILKQTNKPKLKAFLGIILAVSFAIYLAGLAFISIYAIITKNYSILCLSIFIFIPFIIGEKVTYKTLHLYSHLQLWALILSLGYTIFQYEF